MTIEDPTLPRAGAPIIGIFGGSFDPVHNGHLGMTKALLERGTVDRVIFMPAAASPHKVGNAGASPEDRLAMVRLATSDDPTFEVSDYEITRGGISYTIDTAHHFRSVYGEAFRMIIGMDSLNDLHKWYRSAELVKICSFIVYPRPGVAPPTEADLTERFGPELARKLSHGIVDVPVFDVSSTRIRHAFKSGKFPKALIPEAVCQYIRDKGLYR